MWYGQTWTSDSRALQNLIDATKALGAVLSTPVGVVMLEELELARSCERDYRNDYEQMVDAGKRPTKKREDVRARYESYAGESYAGMNALVFMVVQASDYTTTHMAARKAINYELDMIDAVSIFDRDNLRTLRRRCCELVYS